MAERVDVTGGTPPAGEPVHLPGPSYLPVIVAAGAAIALVGVVLNWVLFAVGLATVVLTVARWIRETRQDIADLPLDHQAH